MEFAPFELLSARQSRLPQGRLRRLSAVRPELGVIPVSMEAIVPGYLAGHSPRERYMQLRDRAAVDRTADRVSSGTAHRRAAGRIRPTALP